MLSVLKYVLTSLEKHNLQGRKIFQYHKVDEDGILSATAEFCENFFEQPNNSRQLTGIFFKACITDVIEKYVLTRVIKSYKDVPWLNQFIKWKMKLRNKLYLCAKCTQTESDWSAYIGT